MNADLKRWAVGGVAAAVFVFLGWKAASLYERRGQQLPAPQTVKQQTTTPRDINQPKPVRVPTADISANPLFSDYIPATSKRADDDGIRLVAGFEGSPAAKITRASDGHFIVEQEDPTWKKPHFFLYRVEGVRGQTVTIEIRNVPERWSPINPVYSYTKSLDDLSAFESRPVTNAALRRAANGVQLPDTSGQSWDFIEDTKFFNGSLWFRQKFEADAYICMRYPYTPSYNERYLETLKGKPGVTVLTVGKSKEGRPLRIVKIGEGTEDDEKRKPCVLIYAREHADEQDSSWAAQGAVEFLISNAPEARQVRTQYTFLVIPLLDPDGAAAGLYEHVMDSFNAGSETPESVAYSAFFKTRADEGRQADLVLNLHNLESQEGPHVSNPRLGLDMKAASYCRILYGEFVVPPIKAADLRVGAPTELKGLSPGRLGVWLHATYGSLHLPLELNSQERHRHMTISDLHQVGRLLALACGRFLNSGKSPSLLADIDSVRQHRLINWAKYGSDLFQANAIMAEAKVQARSRRAEQYEQEGL